MMDRTLVGPFLALSFVCGLAGCIDDPTQLSDDGLPLTQEEAAFLGLEAWRAAVEARVSADLESGPPVLASGPQPVVVQFTSHTSVTLACAQGGYIRTSLSASGTIDDVAQTGQVTLSLAQSYDACTVEKDGVAYTINGWPDLSVAIEVLIDEGAGASVSGEISGGIRVSREDQTGICTIALTFGGSEQPDGSGSYYVTGSVCGATIDEMATTTAST